MLPFGVHVWWCIACCFSVFLISRVWSATLKVCGAAAGAYRRSIIVLSCYTAELFVAFAFSFQLFPLSSHNSKSVLATNGIVVRGGHIVRARRRRLHAVAAFIESQLYKAATNWSEYINLRTIELRMSEAMSAYLAQQGRLPVARGGRGRRARAWEGPSVLLTPIVHSTFHKYMLYLHLSLLHMEQSLLLRSVWHFHQWL